MPAPSRKKSNFYSRQFSQAETKDLQAADGQGVLDEIAMLRVAMRRTIELADGVSDLTDMVRVLKALASAAGHLADLLRAQNQVAAEGKPGTAELLAQELAALAADYRLAERYTRGTEAEHGN